MNRSKAGQSGIYKITCKKSGNIYIGSSIHLVVREKEHFNLLKRNVHPNSYLQNTFNKYGIDNLLFEIIEYCNKESVLVKEQYYLDLYKCFAPSHGFNLCKAAGNSYGRIVTEKTREKLRIACKGYKHSEESKKKISKANKGYKRSPEITKKILETKKKKGYKHSEETKQKIREKALGRKVLPKTIQKILNTRKLKQNIL